jgi:hypothetical protein
MTSHPLILEKPIKEIPISRLEIYRNNIKNEIKTLQSTMNSWWYTEQQAEYRQLLEDGRAAIKEIESEIARRSAQYLHSLVQKIEKPQVEKTDTPAGENQEGEASHDPQQ